MRENDNNCKSVDEAGDACDDNQNVTNLHVVRAYDGVSWLQVSTCDDRGDRGQQKVIRGRKR